jgi:hypothetical protein
MTDSAYGEEPPYYSYSATLRIHGSNLAFDVISRELGVDPSHSHRRGESPRAGSRPFTDDAWHLTAPIHRDRELTHHLHELWRLVKPHVEYLKNLEARVDVFCGYRSNDGTAGFAVEAGALEIFMALEVPFSVSVIVDSWLAERLDEPSLQ